MAAKALSTRSMMALALVGCASAVVCAAIEPIVPRLALAGVSAAFSCCAGATAYRRRIRVEAKARAYLASLCSDGQCSTLQATALEPSSPWAPLLAQLDQRLSQHNERIDELEHGRAAAELRARRLKVEWQQMQEILAGLNDPVVAVNRYNELTLANRSAERLLHINANGAEDRALASLVRCEKLVDLLMETSRHKTPVQRVDEIELTCGENDRRWYRAVCRNTAADLDEPSSGGQGAVAVLKDISNEKAIQRRNAQFVSSVSHEMKTPLSSIKAYVELLADGDAEDEETREEFLNVINGQTDRLRRLIDNLLNLARIEAGVVEVSKEPRSLNELLEEATGVVQPAAEQKSVTLCTDLSPMYLAVLADRDMMTQTAINLLSNAVKYTPSGGTVTIRSRMDDGQIVFEVEDTGVGLSAEDCEKVFEKFYRVKKDRDMAAGTGLGLPLAKHIVEDVHGGELSVSSQLDVGSVFRVILPAQAQISS